MTIAKFIWSVVPFDQTLSVEQYQKGMTTFSHKFISLRSHPTFTYRTAFITSVNSTTTEGGESGETLSKE